MSRRLGLSCCPSQRISCSNLWGYSKFITNTIHTLIDSFEVRTRRSDTAELVACSEMKAVRRGLPAVEYLDCASAILIGSEGCAHVASRGLERNLISTVSIPKPQHRLRLISQQRVQRMDVGTSSPSSGKVDEELSKKLKRIQLRDLNNRDAGKGE